MKRRNDAQKIAVHYARSLDCPTPGKVGWVRRGEARTFLRRAVHNETAGKRGKLAVYRCPCGLFHLGHRWSVTRAEISEAAIAARRMG